MLRYLIKKEFLQLIRDRRMLPIIFIAPVIQVTLFGYAAITDVKNINTVVCDLDTSQKSREYLAAYFHNGYFSRVADLFDCTLVDQYLDHGTADLALIVPGGFERDIAGGKPVKVQAIINGTDSNIGGVGLNYVSHINSRFSQTIMVQRLTRLGQGQFALFDLEDRVWYNPELKSRYYMVPGIFAMILMIITMMLTAMAIVREKEIGTIEQLIVTPAKSYQIVIGKLIPFTLIGLIDVLLILSVTLFWFQVPLRGSLPLLFGMLLLYLMNTLGLGLFVSTVSKTQQQAMMTVMFFIMLPFIYLSGFIFPIENMPKGVQYLTTIIPLRYFLTIIRGIFLKGVGLEVLWPDALKLGGIGVFVVLLAIVRFKKQL
jgi:ABC-2 type transport system permease protein